MENFKIDESRLFEGFKGINIDRFDFTKCKNILELGNLINSDPSYKTLDQSILKLDPMTLEEAKKAAIDFYVEHFNIHNINYVDEDKLDKAVKDMPDDTKPREFYDNINGILTSISPFDLPITITNSDIDSRISKPFYAYPGHPTESNRKIYFSKMSMGRLINKITPCFIAHEVMHLETESVLGYTDDYLNKEVLSIFIEKIAAMKMDKSGSLLKVVEKLRFRDLVNRYNTYLMYKNMLSQEQMIEILTYVKSTLVAEKLFDMYMQEKKETNRDRYIQDIQKVMNGKVKLDEILVKRGATPDKCKELTYLKRHI